MLIFKLKIRCFPVLIIIIIIIIAGSFSMKILLKALFTDYIITPVIGFIINPALGVHHSQLPGESVIKECYGIINVSDLVLIDSILIIIYANYKFLIPNLIKYRLNLIEC